MIFDITNNAEMLDIRAFCIQRQSIHFVFEGETLSSFPWSLQGYVMY